MSIDLGDTATAELLIAKGANVNAKNDNGDTPLHAAAIGGYTLGVAKALIAKGAYDGAVRSLTQISVPK